MNNENKGFIAALDAKLDAIGDKLKKKEGKGPTDLLGGVIFLADDEAKVYVYGEEAYVTAGMLAKLNVSCLMVGDVPVIHL